MHKDLGVNCKMLSSCQEFSAALNCFVQAPSPSEWRKEHRETGSIHGALIFQPESQRESVEGMKILSAGALEGQRSTAIKHNLNTEEEHKEKYPPFNIYFEEMPTIICATDSNIFIATVNNMLVVHCIQIRFKGPI